MSEVDSIEIVKKFDEIVELMKKFSKESVKSVEEEPVKEPVKSVEEETVKEPVKSVEESVKEPVKECTDCTECPMKKMFEGQCPIKKMLGGKCPMTKLLDGQCPMKYMDKKEFIENVLEKENKLSEDAFLNEYNKQESIFCTINNIVFLFFIFFIVLMTVKFFKNF